MNTSVKQTQNTYLNAALVALAYLLGLLIIGYCLLGKVLFQLDTVMLDRSGDGFKNYFSFAWQYKNEGGFWFEGMQYPYGDLLGFADGQPAIVMFLVGLKKLGIDFSGNEMLLVQGLPFLGAFLGVYFLHKIIRSYQVPNWWSVITVLFCVALSPQLYRLNAHFALAYMFCFPSIWYLLILSEKNRSREVFYAVFMSLLLLIYGFIHPYHLLIGTIFLIGYFMVKATKKEFRWYILIAGLSAIAFYLIINNLLDPADDRPQNPWGAWHYKAEVSDLFPFYGWYANLVGDTYSIRSKYHEGYSYIGILIFAIPFLVYRRKEIMDAAFDQATKIKDILLAAILVLMFAMGMHILLTDHKILDWISSLRQFRALGRFSWPFYYVGFISLSVMFYRATISIHSKWKAGLLFLFVITMWAVDGNSYMKIFHDKRNEYLSPNELYTNSVIQDGLNKANLTADKFQAIMPLPVSMEGAEKIRTYRSYFPKIQTIPFAFQTGLPMIGAHMSRTSLSRILKQYQLGASAFVEKEAIKDFKNRKDVLVILSHKDSLLYADFVNRGFVIDRNKHTTLYRMPMDSLEKVQYIHTDSLGKAANAVFYSDFTDENGRGLLSKGFKIINSNTELATVNVDSLRAKKIQLSFWLRADADDSKTPSVDVKIRNSDKKEIKNEHFSDMDMKRCEVINNWIQLKKEITIPEMASEITWFISSEKLAIDHALITVSSEEIFWQKMDDRYMIYDHFIAQYK